MWSYWDSGIVWYFKESYFLRRLLSLNKIEYRIMLVPKQIAFFLVLDYDIWSISKQITFGNQNQH